MFKKWKAVVFLFLFLWVITTSSSSQQKTDKADSIINQALNHKELYGNYIQSYDAEVYIKGDSYIKKKNFLFRFAPDFLYWDRKGRNNFTESFIDIHFNAPNHFIQQITAVNGTQLNTNEIQERVMQFLNVNIYNPTIFNGQVLVPGEDVHKYYRFEYVSCADTLNYRIHKIKIIPLIRSQKLISGYFNIVEGLWTIFSFDINGRSEFSNFRVETEFGMPGNDFLLPVKTEITFQISLLGNEVVNHYFSSFNYKSVSKHQTKSKTKEINYDLSEYFSFKIDSVQIIKDSLFWEEKRPVSLTSSEKSIYESRIGLQQKTDSLPLTTNKSWDFSPGLIIPKRFRYNNTQFSYSGLFNPFKLAYSKTNGVSYWQQFKLNRKFNNGQNLQFKPNIGYLFQKEEFYFSTPTQWLFQPRKMGEIYFTFENRNQSYNSTMIDKINKEMPDTIIFDDFDLEYFRHFHLELKSKYELSNGLLASAGIDLDWYNPVKSKNTQSPLKKLQQEKIDEDILDIVSNKYSAFAPTFELIWTPHQYYRINGKKKEYVGSSYPTFSMEYSRGVKDFFSTNSDYERIEADIQQKIPIGLMNSFQYYIGGGWFTKTHSVYFADFKRFQRRNFPESWNDPIGGVFHLLDGEWYNLSNSYLQAHFMYETPFAVLRLFKGVTKDILTERFYISQLYTPNLPCYTEAGFGVGNFFVNAGIFISLEQGKYQSFGAKAVFELGR